MPPRLTAISGFVNAISLNDVAAQLRFAHADVDNIGVGWRDRYRADRGALKKGIGNRVPGGSPVSGSPKPAASGAEIILKGTGSTAGYGERAPSAERADIAPAKCRENGKILRESRPAQK